MTAVIATAIKDGWNPWLVLALIQIFSCPTRRCSAFPRARPRAAGKCPEGIRPVRALATVGWMSGALLIGALSLDVRRSRAISAQDSGCSWRGSHISAGAGNSKSAEHLSWHERLGLDALTLLRDRDTRVVFITTTLFNIPLAAFYPYARRICTTSASRTRARG